MIFLDRVRRVSCVAGILSGFFFVTEGCSGGNQPAGPAGVDGSSSGDAGSGTGDADAPRLCLAECSDPPEAPSKCMAWCFSVHVCMKYDAAGRDKGFPASIQLTPEGETCVLHANGKTSALKRDASVSSCGGTFDGGSWHWGRKVASRPVLVLMFNGGEEWECDNWPSQP